MENFIFCVVDASDVVLVFLVLNLNIFHTFF